MRKKIKTIIKEKLIIIINPNLNGLNKENENNNRIVEELLDRDLQNNCSMRKFEEFQEKKRR